MQNAWLTKPSMNTPVFFLTKPNSNISPKVNYIQALVKAEHYDFTKTDLRKVIGEILGKKIEPEELSAMVCEVYESEIKAKGGNGSAQAVADWLAALD